MFNVPTYLLQQQTLTASVTFTYAAPSVTWTPRHLYVRLQATSTSLAECKLQLNGDTGANYNRQMLRGQSSTPAALRVQNETGYLFGSIDTTLHSGGWVLIPDAFSTRSQKAFVSLTGWKGDSEITAFTGRWANTSAITSVTVLPSAGIWKAGSIFDFAVVDESFQNSEEIV